VWSTHLHALGRNVPNSLLSVELIAGRSPYLTGADTGKGEELKGSFESRPAVVFVDRREELAELLFIGDRCTAVGFRRQERALEGQGGVRLDPKSNNRHPKDTADHAAQTPGRFPSAALFDLLEELENFGRGDLFNGTLGERAGKVFEEPLGFGDR
jgi:hypothetical protein